jgi:hypothetical protein
MSRENDEARGMSKSSNRTGGLFFIRFVLDSSFVLVMSKVRFRGTRKVRARLALARETRYSMVATAAAAITER